MKPDIWPVIMIAPITSQPMAFISKREIIVADFRKTRKSATPS
jgi:hypothetical protein